MEYCEKHNRDKLLSKYPDKRTGEKTYWCPDCYDEWKKAMPERRGTTQAPYNQDKLLEAIKIVNENIKLLHSKIDKLLGQ